MGTVLFVLVLLVVGGYVMSLLLHPYTTCETCRGKGNKHYGALFSSAFRPCWACRGSQTKQRFGAWALGIGEPRKPRINGIFAPATKHFAKPPRRRFLGIF